MLNSDSRRMARRLYIGSDMKTFKSERAAKMAYTKALTAFDAKEDEGRKARDTYRETMRLVGSMPTEEYEALRAIEVRCEAEAKGLFEVMRAVYHQATEQGFYIRSWHFGTNPTRDLIAANMD